MTPMSRRFQLPVRCFYVDQKLGFREQLACLGTKLDQSLLYSPFVLGFT